MITSLATKRISVISQWQTFPSVLPTRWRQKAAGIEITSLSPYLYIWSQCERHGVGKHDVMCGDKRGRFIVLLK